MLCRRIRRRGIVPAVSVVAVAGVYVMLSLYLFDLEVKATLVPRRSDQPQPLVIPEGRQGGLCCTDSSEKKNVSDSYNSLVFKPTVLASADATRIETGARNECEWAKLRLVKGSPYFLTTVFHVRIYEKDLSELTSLDVKHWLLYLRYAGVEHVYLYDMWELPGESQREQLDVFIREGYLTYFDRHELTPFDLEKSKHASYQHCIDNFGKDTTWQLAIDIDEYPFCPEDTEPRFLSRYVKKYSEENKDVSEITMSNFLYLGMKNIMSKEFLFDKLLRHTHGPANPLVKPIYKPVDIKKPKVHHNILRRGVSRTAPSSQLRMNHYWGARLQNWGPDTEEILAKTEEDRGMEPVVAAFKTCKKYLNDYTAIARGTLLAM